jgi:16S rRNA (guanine1207-N2)-methyltransferase
MSHYFINDDKLESRQYEFSYTFKDFRLNFRADNGVFSKNRVDFGTYVLINSLPEFHDELILDVGCGVGVIGLCLAKANPKTSIHLIDINSKAIELAKKNALNNKINNVVIYESDVYSQVHETFDVIITNPPIRAGKAVIYKIVEEALTKLNVGGKLYLVIQKKQGAPSMKEKLLDVFGNCTEVNKEKGYYIFGSTKDK